LLTHKRLDPAHVALVLLPLLALGIAWYKARAYDYSLQEVLPEARHDVVLEMQLDGHDLGVKVTSFLPTSSARQIISEEHDDSPGFELDVKMKGLSRQLLWHGSALPNASRIRYSFGVVSREVRFDLDDDIPLPDAYPSSVTGYLTADENIQVDDPQIREELAKIGAAQGGVRERLQRIYDAVSGLKSRPFKGTTDALTALRLGEASCNGKSRLFVALARAAGIPARLIGGLILKPGSSRTTHQWAEAYVAGHWVPFDTINHHFAELPAHYLTLYYNDETLFTHSKDINFRYHFEVDKVLVPTAEAKAVLGPLNVWAMFERLGLPFSLLKTVLMLPIGALVVVLFRNVIGMPTIGTFLPALIAAAATETGPWWGLVGLLIVVLAVCATRWSVDRLKLLHSPTLAILLTTVTVSMLATSLFAERLGALQLTRISLFPIAVLAITSERFYLLWAEEGPGDAITQMAGTLVVLLGCFVVMNSLALQVLIVAFPEVLLLVVAMDIYLGRWVGMRLSEYLRFRRLLGPATTGSSA
jgi:hypothetical protein